ncbi:MAG: Holliday junction resolvase RuvX [Hyphomicrobiales bacterium]|nr:Holliday junction resolvase RuvX [Hyphomicrobiales bacterium]
MATAKTIRPLESFLAALPPRGTLIGMDVGTKSIGLALSDLTRSIASTLETVRRVKFTPDAARVLELAGRHGVVGFVIGYPVNLDGSRGPRAQATEAFSRSFAALTPLPILLWDERLSTVAAERSLLEADLSRAKRADRIDMIAAVIILQGALDRMRNMAAPGDVVSDR